MYRTTVSPIKIHAICVNNLLFVTLKKGKSIFFLHWIQVCYCIDCLLICVSFCLDMSSKYIDLGNNMKDKADS